MPRCDFSRFLTGEGKKGRGWPRHFNDCSYDPPQKGEIFWVLCLCRAISLQVQH